MGKGLANPTAMVFSAAIMLDWLAEQHGHAVARDAAQRIETAVDQPFANGLKPCELGSFVGTAAVAKVVLEALERDSRGG